MQNSASVELIRDCDAIQIPAGNTATLRAGTPVDITQSLGGTYTVQAMGALYRISSQDADAQTVCRCAAIHLFDSPLERLVGTGTLVGIAFALCSG